MDVSIISATPTRKVIASNYREEKWNKKHPHNFLEYFQYIFKPTATG